MPLSLIIAITLSLVLHAGLLFPGIMQRFSVAPPAPALQATLRLPPKPESVPAESLLKNTIDPEETLPPVPSPPPVKPPEPQVAQVKPKSVVKQEVKAAQRKLSEHLFYPPEAVAQGLEGEVRLILKLADDGAIGRVSIAASSGFPILDNAAVKAAYAMGNLSSATSRELIMPVIFRLQ